MGPGIWRVNSKVQAGADLGEEEPNKAEVVSGGRAEVWAPRGVGVCG